ncbi:MAG: hypothetical protein JO167_11940 [Alphaproteobacteria bacterium]|nr:hypothetical protein [Alphaproteobacteria bacterium]MBV9902994.1 hypothetical protein [Alphaproteobacteria bacterium]
MKGPFDLEAFRLDIADDRPWRAHPDYDALVDRMWEKRVIDAKARDHHLWDGTHYRLLDPAELTGRGPLHVGTVSFRYLATWQLLQAEHAAHKLDPFHHVSVASLLHTANDDYVFGKRALNGAIDLIGGGFQKEGGVQTFADNFRKEIQEELGVTPDRLGPLTGLGIVRAANSNVLVIADVPARLTNDELLAAFERREDNEMAAPVFVPAAELTRFLLGLTSYRRLIPQLL